MFWLPLGLNPTGNVPNDVPYGILQFVLTRVKLTIFPLLLTILVDNEPLPEVNVPLDTVLSSSDHADQVAFNVLK